MCYAVDVLSTITLYFMRNKIISSFFAFALCFCFSTVAMSQITVSCPNGDNYKCMTYTDTNGEPVNVFKGTGDATITIPQQ
jgi:hypothetical protein